jgi:hypothetical protein
MVKGTVEPLENGERSRVTIKLDFEGLLVPLVVCRQAASEMPRNQRKAEGAPRERHVGHAVGRGAGVEPPAR